MFIPEIEMESPSIHLVSLVGTRVAWLFVSIISQNQGDWILLLCLQPFENPVSNRTPKQPSLEVYQGSFQYVVMS